MPTIIQGPFVGATSSAAGAQGLVPAPAVADVGKALLADGSYGTPIVPPTSSQLQGTFKEFGGEVAYLDDYDFRVSPCTYVINGTRYTSAQTDLTLSAADGSNDRFDTIVVNSSGVATIVTGTAAANPAFPDIDPLTQLALTTISVGAGTTEPDIVPEEIYRDNGEWTTSQSGGTFDADSTSGPFAGTKCVLATAAASGHYVRFTKASPVSLAGQKQLVAMIQSITNDWPNQKSLRLTWYLSGAKVGQSVTVSGGRYGFVDTNVSTFQQLVIPIGDFLVPASTNVDRLEVLVNGTGATISFRLDDIVIEPESDDAVQTNPGTASSTVSGTVKTSSNETDPVVYTKADVDTLLSALGGGTKTLFRWRPTEGQPPSSSFARLSTRNGRATLLFAKGESMLFPAIVPEGADFTTGIKDRLFFSATATSGNVIFTGAWERGVTDIDSDSFATGADSSATATSGTAGIPTLVTMDHGSGAAIDSLVAGDLAWFKLTRKNDIADTMSGDAEVLMIEGQQR